MSKKSKNHKFDNTIIDVVKENSHHFFSIKLAEDIGLSKACILANISDCRDLSFTGICKFFPYISSESLNILIDELIEEGYLKKAECNE